VCVYIYIYISCTTKTANFEVLTEVLLKVQIFSDVTPSHLVSSYRRWEGTLDLPESRFSSPTTGIKHQDCFHLKTSALRTFETSVVFPYRQGAASQKTWIFRVLTLLRSDTSKHFV